ncbi:phage uncharacterized protein, putative [Helicobacter bizzozeronii CIII-1]|uniref:Phage uncharacterized protein, putative n=1 Tax=Helicobacter bizzozeronii (strain CIII-1) TaxID=1002804 RepID=F8KQN7_HELBC|nr:phage protein [Helicobacter bizzozeronii]CCB79041.1 phage uncharacterized protein, putative [Helicobacter bizzozeronii CIII-1]
MTPAKRELALRALAQRDLYTFVKLKWARYNLAPFLDSWHIAYLCKVLECTQPNTTGESDLLTRLMINMPPSYGKTEIIARCFIAWSLGLDRSRKFFYISYSDDLCRKIANQVRDLMKSKFYAQIFPIPLEFLQDNAQEFVLREGGGLFVTTLKSALTGFHAHQILIDDPIKVSEMSSKSAVKAVNANFKESVLSRLQDNQSNITILMQRLGLNDLCAFLLSEREFEPAQIASWKVIKLKALNAQEENYSIKDFSYTRPPNTPLFEARHNASQLEDMRLQMGNDEFSAQYQQEPLATSGGYFEPQYFKQIFKHELGQFNTFIFVDNALSLKESADNRAIVVVGVENYQENARYVVLDVYCGVWSEEQTINYILQAKEQYPEAKTYIESDGGGLVLHRLLLVALAQHNQRAKEQHKSPLNDSVFCYTPSRQVSKVAKIKAIRPLYHSRRKAPSFSYGDIRRMLFRA